MTSRLPKLVAFDLDYTLWPLWIDTHAVGPLRRPSDTTLNEVRDKYGERICLYHDVGAILHRLRDAGIIIAAASRTHTPDLAREALSLLLIPHKAGDVGGRAVPAIEFFDQLEMYPGSKIKHFKRIHERTGTPYNEMVFYDDEIRNKEVESLGITFIHVTDGLNGRVLEKGLEEWRKRHPVEVVEDAGGDQAEQEL